MLLVLKYLYVHLYKVAAGIRWYNARFVALLYLCVIHLFLVLPFFIHFVSKLSISKTSFFVLALVFAYLIYWVNEKWIYNPKTFKEALVLFRKESRLQRITGYIISLLVLIISPVIFMLLLWWLV